MRMNMNAVCSKQDLGYKALDEMETPNVRIWSFEDWGVPQVNFLNYGRFDVVAKIFGVMGQVPLSIRALWKCGRHEVIIANGSIRSHLLVCFFNRAIFWRTRNILLFEIYTTSNNIFKKFINRYSLKGATVIAVWSPNYVTNFANHLGLSTELFFVMPYKANHSKSAPLSFSEGGYIFSGGNTSRDYATLFSAIEGTGIPALVSTTEPSVVRGLSIPSNVTLLSAREPHFAKLMARSRFVVVAMKKGILRGAGEATILNAMWQGKPVVAADDVSARFYIQDGVNGFAVDAGDVIALRKRILELWDRDDERVKMGQNAFQLVSEKYTHEIFKKRMLNLAALISQGIFNRSLTAGKKVLC